VAGDEASGHSQNWVRNFGKASEREKDGGTDELAGNREAGHMVVRSGAELSEDSGPGPCGGEILNKHYGGTTNCDGGVPFELGGGDGGSTEGKVLPLLSRKSGHEGEVSF